MTDLPVTAASEAEEIFRVGQVLSRSFGILRRHALVFIPLGALQGLPDLLHDGFMRGGRSGALDAGVLVLMSLLQACVQALVVFGAFRDMRGEKVRFGESFGRGLARLLPAIMASIGQGVVIGVGALLLLVPGFIALAMLYVTIPVCVVEKLGPFKSLDRSAWLTKNHRWKVLGIILLPLLVAAIVTGVIPEALAPLGAPLAAALAVFVAQAVFSAYAAITAVVTYHDLRVAKEGVDVERISAVFD